MHRYSNGRGPRPFWRLHHHPGDLASIALFGPFAMAALASVTGHRQVEFRKVVEATGRIHTGPDGVLPLAACNSVGAGGERETDAVHDARLFLFPEAQRVDRRMKPVGGRHGKTQRRGARPNGAFDATKLQVCDEQAAIAAYNVAADHSLHAVLKRADSGMTRQAVTTLEFEVEQIDRPVLRIR